MKNRLLAFLQLLATPFLYILFIFVEPQLIPEMPKYVVNCFRCIKSGERL